MIDERSGCHERDLAEDLRAHIYQTHASGPRRDSRWVMNSEWFNEVRRMDDSSGRVLYRPGLLSAPEYLLGIPVEIRADGGVPHLEPREMAGPDAGVPG